MVVLSVIRLPQDCDLSRLSDSLLDIFADIESRAYISEICARKSSESIKESLFSLLLLSQMYKDMAEDSAPPPLVRQASGKPYFKNSSLEFSISHSKGYIAVALSDSGCVGVDIEAESMSSERSIKIAQRFLSKECLTAIKASPPLFQRLWTQKEAESKYFGESLPSFLKKHQENNNSDIFLPENTDISLHSFFIDNIPISLCTQRKRETVIFKKTSLGTEI